MNETHIERIALELHLIPGQVKSVSLLLKEGATIPFIARYRKEATNSLDEVAITAIRDRLEQLAELDNRRDAIFRSLEERGLLNDELKEKLNKAETMTILEDIYLPFRPKRRTRAAIAREKGLEPLAQRLFAQDGIDPVNSDPFEEAKAFINPEKEVHSSDDALSGARDIMAEWISEDAEARAGIRGFFLQKSVFKSKVLPDKEEEGAKYRDYYDWEEPVNTAPSHRILAMRRGEKEGALTLRVVPPEQEAIAIIETLFIKRNDPGSNQVKQSLEDSCRRLLFPSIETEVRVITKDRADEDAIRVFAENLRQLLLAPPLGRKNVLAIDPGFRTGCKVVCLDSQGKLLQTNTIFPHQSEKEATRAGETVIELCRNFSVEAIAIGNGTAGRETETFLKRLKLPGEIPVIIVNESGASVYSASETAREEFPDYDITVRGAASIGRRLMDPLAELVKIDPKSIGVGQYQHDVDQRALKRGLDDVVTSCVNAVGVEVNTSSKQLLTYVSGLGPGLAKAIVGYRDEHGPFGSRKELKKVPRLGPKAFEQAAGFLRINGAKNPLDESAVHPESYPIVEAMAQDIKSSVKDLIRNETLRKQIDVNRYLTDTVGLPTLNDILNELAKPGRDPRDQFEAFAFTEGIEKIEDVKPGMRLPGIVTNITAFGAFVDIGVHQEGLVHISQLSNRFVKNPNEAVKVHQQVIVTVLDVDIGRKRISLSMKDNPLQTPQKHKR
ncbi:MAG: Tex family protein [Proteobacteria bacterium]|nr:Tex family protein [Pseudomonadota bacterium]